MDKIPFSKDELKKTRDYGSYHGLTTPIPPKENLLRAIHHNNPLWIPLRSDEVFFTPRIIPDNIARAFVMESKPYDGPVGGKDMFGVEWEYIPVAGGSMVRPGKPLLENACGWKSAVSFPDVDSWDWETSAEENSSYRTEERYVVSWMFTGYFERLISFMEFENAAVALIDEDQAPAVKELFQALTELYKKILYRLKKYFNIDAVFFHDDWGSQKSSFFSPAVCREMIAPYLKQLVDYCHDISVVFDFHSCGHIENLVPIMIECGVDKWAGQPMNDKAKLIQMYGDKLLIGSTDDISAPPGCLPRSPEEYAARAAQHMQIYGAGLPDKLFYLMSVTYQDDMIAAFYEAGRKILCGTDDRESK